MTKSTGLNHLTDAHNITTGLAHRHCTKDEVPRIINIKRVGKGSRGEDRASTRVYN
jgi:hypothetical protein